MDGEAYHFGQQQECRADSRKGTLMKRTRHQQGYIYKKGNLWMLRYYDNQQMPDGSITRVQKARKLVEAVGSTAPRQRRGSLPKNSLSQ